MTSKIEFSRKVSKNTQILQVLVQSLIRALLSLKLAVNVRGEKNCKKNI